MYRELFVSTVLSAAWLSMCFVAFGFLYGVVSEIVGPFRLMAWEGALGHIEMLGGKISIGRVSIWIYAAFMTAACLPINRYWQRRVEDARSEAANPAE